eukprot:CAMPEP_0174378592 /NCGR_PEP_ID=MMETSP0811_2-20130205/122150_1 /TAXON_ID=73025 ORGANISM="Eutreptiella gymnastica-like, Strain CCMP1594" /NCGR_SAMPLE_ID=MMETSP0811_2 /ASSEMBLY_ACC=CAM_ASM_000667 /LENGTH=100 /DNA_ID=CAMNT_0015530853 /DNA_START=837 /DNA_END=1140 /DNA_ORIENTATION=+
MPDTSGMSGRELCSTTLDFVRLCRSGPPDISRRSSVSAKRLSHFLSVGGKRSRAVCRATQGPKGGPSLEKQQTETLALTDQQLEGQQRLLEATGGGWRGD